MESAFCIYILMVCSLMSKARQTYKRTTALLHCFKANLIMIMSLMRNHYVQKLQKLNSWAPRSKYYVFEPYAGALLNYTIECWQMTSEKSKKNRVLYKIKWHKFLWVEFMALVSKKYLIEFRFEWRKRDEYKTWKSGHRSN